MKIVNLTQMKGHEHQRSQQRGAALLTAMLVASLATIAAVAMISQQQLDIRRTYNVLDSEQAYLYLLGAEAFAIQVLAEDLKDNKIDTLGEDWASEKGFTEFVEGGLVGGNIVDLQARFNLNNLLDSTDKIDPVNRERFTRLLQALDLSVDLIPAVVDWLDQNESLTFPDGAEDGEYLNLEHPYRTANRNMVSHTELLSIKGFSNNGISNGTYEKLAPYVTALPLGSDINVNTASKEVIMALGPNVTESDADDLIKVQEEKGFKTIGEFQKHEVGKSRDLVPDNLVVASHYFLVTSYAEIGRASATLRSVVHRDPNGNIEVILRTQGGM